MFRFRNVEHFVFEISSIDDYINIVKNALYQRIFDSTYVVKQCSFGLFSEYINKIENLKLKKKFEKLKKKFGESLLIFPIVEHWVIEKLHELHGLGYGVNFSHVGIVHLYQVIIGTFKLTIPILITEPELLLKYVDYVLKSKTVLIIPITEHKQIETYVFEKEITDFIIESMYSLLNELQFLVNNFSNEEVLKIFQAIEETLNIKSTTII